MFILWCCLVLVVVFICVLFINSVVEICLFWCGLVIWCCLFGCVVCLIFVGNGYRWCWFGRLVSLILPVWLV